MGMHLPRSIAEVPSLVVLEQAPSTNAALRGRVEAGNAPHFTAVATMNQTAGKGRLGREWTAPAGTSLAVSVFLSAEKVQGTEGAVSRGLGWLPLLAGLAMRRAVASLVAVHAADAAVTLKWPNDVLIDRHKVCGVLAESVGAGGAAHSGVIVGAGLNLTMTAAQLPVVTATSLSLHGVPIDGIEDAALATYLRELRSLYDDFVTAGFDADAGLRAMVTRECETIGRAVRVELPGAEPVYGVAEGVDAGGRLEVRPGVASPHEGLPGFPTSANPSGLAVIAVAAGDVTHLRYP